MKKTRILIALVLTLACFGIISLMKVSAVKSEPSVRCPTQSGNLMPTANENGCRECLEGCAHIPVVLCEKDKPCIQPREECELGCLRGPCRDRDIDEPPSLVENDSR
jgi:hypothetical protein